MSTSESEKTHKAIERVRNLDNLNPGLKQELIDDLRAERKKPKKEPMKKEKEEAELKRKKMKNAVGNVAQLLGVSAWGTAAWAFIFAFLGVLGESDDAMIPEYAGLLSSSAAVHAPVPVSKAGPSKDYQFEDYQKEKDVVADYSIEDSEKLEKLFERLDQGRAALDAINRYYNKGENYAQNTIKAFTQEHPTFLKYSREEQARLSTNLFPEYFKDHPQSRISMRWLLAFFLLAPSLILTWEKLLIAKHKKQSWLDFLSERHTA